MSLQASKLLQFQLGERAHLLVNENSKLSRTLIFWLDNYDEVSRQVGMVPIFVSFEVLRNEASHTWRR